MQRVATLPQWLFETLTADETAMLLGLGLDAAMKTPAFRQLFFPALADWLSRFEQTLTQWHSYLERTGLVTEAQMRSVRHFDEATSDFYSVYGNISPAEVFLLDPSDPKYRSMILCEPLPLTLESGW
jgi:hypothetical protein